MSEARKEADEAEPKGGYPYEAERVVIAVEKLLAPPPQQFVTRSHTGPFTQPEGGDDGE